MCVLYSKRKEKPFPSLSLSFSFSVLAQPNPFSLSSFLFLPLQPISAQPSFPPAAPAPPTSGPSRRPPPSPPCRRQAGPVCRGRLPSPWATRTQGVRPRYASPLPAFLGPHAKALAPAYKSDARVPLEPQPEPQPHPVCANPSHRH